jgi:hypothetical protein
MKRIESGIMPVVTAGEARALVERVNEALRSLDALFRGGVVSQELRRSWDETLARWRAFVSRHRQVPSRAVARTATVFAAEARFWRRALDEETADGAAHPKDDLIPAEVGLAMDDVGATIARLDAAILASEARPQVKSAWRRFAEDWRLFRVTRDTAAARRWRDTQERLRAYERRARTWSSAFRRERAAEGPPAGRAGVRRASRAEVAGIGGPRVDATVNLVTTAERARAFLDGADKHLQTASSRLPGVPLIAAAAGMREVLRDGVEMVRRYVARVRPQLPASGPIADETLRRKVALAVVQAEDQLKRVDEAVSDPSLKLLPAFAEIFTDAAKTVGKVAQSTFSWLPIVAGAAGIVLVSSLVRR